MEKQISHKEIADKGKIMENKEIKKVEPNATTQKTALTILDKPLFIGAEEYDPKEVVNFVLRQAGLKDYTAMEINYIINTCKEKGLNPMKGEISFFKARNGMLQAIPKYTTQLELLGREFRKDPEFITFNVYIDITEQQEGKATARADYLNQQGVKYSREISLFSGDGKNTNGMVRFMLQKQATLQFIRVYYPHIDLGYEMEELQSYNSGIKGNEPLDHRVVDVQVQPKAKKEVGE